MVNNVLGHPTQAQNEAPGAYLRSLAFFWSHPFNADDFMEEEYGISLKAEWYCMLHISIKSVFLVFCVSDWHLHVFSFSFFLLASGTKMMTTFFLLSVFYSSYQYCHWQLSNRLTGKDCFRQCVWWSHMQIVLKLYWPLASSLLISMLLSHFPVPHLY